MLKLRIEFLTPGEREELIQLLETKYCIIEKSKEKPSKDPDCKLKLQHLVIVKKDDQK